VKARIIDTEQQNKYVSSRRKVATRSQLAIYDYLVEQEQHNVTQLMTIAKNNE